MAKRANLVDSPGIPINRDSKNNTITGNPAAISLMRRAMRAPWNVRNPKYAA